MLCRWKYSYLERVVRVPLLFVTGLTSSLFGACPNQESGFYDVICRHFALSSVCEGERWLFVVLI